MHVGRASEGPVPAARPERGLGEVGGVRESQKGAQRQTARDSERHWLDRQGERTGESEQEREGQTKKQTETREPGNDLRKAQGSGDHREGRGKRGEVAEGGGYSARGRRSGVDAPGWPLEGVVALSPRDRSKEGLWV